MVVLFTMRTVLRRSICMDTGMCISPTVPSTPIPSISTYYPLYVVATSKDVIKYVQYLLPPLPMHSDFQIGR